MRILFCIPAVPLASNHSGEASRAIQSFHALVQLANELHVARIGTAQALAATAEFEQASAEATAARPLATSWYEIAVQDSGSTNGRWHRAWQQFRDPVQAAFPQAREIAGQLRPLINRLQPDLIWAETSAIAAAIYCLQPAVPWVFSQLDWLYRVRRFRWQDDLNWRRRWLLNRLRAAEMSIYPAATVALSCSKTDAQRLQQAGCQRVFWIPYSYDSGPPIPEEVRPADDLRIIHLGSTETTANRVGLQAYFQEAHDQVVTLCREQKSEPQLWLLGDTSRAKEPLAGQIRRSGAKLTGHVTDFAATLRPFDVTIIPYEHDTGFRSKMPLLFCYGQVLVSTRAALVGSWVEGLEKVCVVVNSIADFPQAIANLAADPAGRERLGREANTFFNCHFTHEKIQPLYRNVLEATSN